MVLFETIAAGLFALITLSIWSNQDVKTGYVHNVTLVIPVILAAIFFMIVDQILQFGVKLIFGLGG